MFLFCGARAISYSYLLEKMCFLSFKRQTNDNNNLRMYCRVDTTWVFYKVHRFAEQHIYPSRCATSPIGSFGSGSRPRTCCSNYLQTSNVNINSLVWFVMSYCVRSICCQSEYRFSLWCTSPVLSTSQSKLWSYNSPLLSLYPPCIAAFIDVTQYQ